MPGILSDTTRDIIAIVGLCLGLIQAVVAGAAFFRELGRSSPDSTEQGVVRALGEFLRTNADVLLPGFLLLLQVIASMTIALFAPNYFVSREHPLRSLVIASLITLSYLGFAFFPLVIDDWFREARPRLLARWRLIFFSTSGLLFGGTYWSLFRILAAADRTIASWSNHPNSMVAWLIYQLFAIAVASLISWLFLLDHVADRFWEERWERKATSNRKGPIKFKGA